MNQPSKELQVAIQAAKNGAEIARSFSSRKYNTTLKEDKTVVTEADIAAEQAIINTITSEFPEANFLAEESGGDTTHDSFWIIDPIDGTRAFSRGVEQWSVLVAYYAENEVKVGVCIIPGIDVVAYAEKGKGCFINGKRVHVSDTDSLSGSFGSFGSIRHFPSIKPIEKLARSGIALRSYEHSYAACLVAQGKMDLLVDAYAKIWDYAAFVPIIEEAGGSVTTFSGTKWNLHKDMIIASNGKLHNDVISIVNEKKE